MSNERRALKSNRFMAHLVGALEMGQDIGPYGRKIFATVAQYFLSADDTLMLLKRNLGEQEAREVMKSVEGEPPPRRGKVVEYTKRQNFPILPNNHDAHLDDLYAGLTFPPEIQARIPKFERGVAHEAREDATS
ncbi:hypothetical protein [Deinococcus yavapaiensis]|uniref:Uncharacterized protein n=1 Tax=Deinococcus yavapaiensis KR-236 TaxID=694435 RepID=A0A318S230_9DEIO|nr:hypothetical protein [Deinococcus yavapaiensis]PYE51877.1 hypothetical protein DES52_11478 [Deinococcus yavapaiensis KR-236]